MVNQAHHHTQGLVKVLWGLMPLTVQPGSHNLSMAMGNQHLCRWGEGLLHKGYNIIDACDDNKGKIKPDKHTLVL